MWHGITLMTALVNNIVYLVVFCKSDSEPSSASSINKEVLKAGRAGDVLFSL